MSHQLLPRIAQGLQVSHVLRGFDRRHVVVPRFVEYLQLHQAPTLCLGKAEWVKYSAPISSDNVKAAWRHWPRSSSNAG